MIDMYDSVGPYPMVELQDPSEPLGQYHKDETEIIVHLNEVHSLSFYLNDLGLSDLLENIIERQKIRAIQNVVPTEM
jgi:hypothetical protein